MSEQTFVVDAPLAAPRPADPLAEDGRYEDRGAIGAGGMGEVRRVYDRVLGRTVAMKLLRWRALHRADLQEMFVAESRVTASLQHPGIVPVHDRGVLPDGRIWYTMTEVRGETLSQLIARVHEPEKEAAGWTLRRLLGVFYQVCETMAYVHSRGVVHRDLKPDNIMVGAFNEVLIMDWGIAKVRGRWDMAGV